jgi:hypothetical protein
MPQEINKHYFRANFVIPPIVAQSRCHDWKVGELQIRKWFDISKYVGIDKIKALRNCVEPETWKHILDAAIRNTGLF